MGAKHVRLGENGAELITGKQRESEPFSEAIERLTSEWRITDSGGERSQAEIDRHKAMLEDMDRESIEDVEGTLEEMGADIE